MKQAATRVDTARLGADLAAFLERFRLARDNEKVLQDAMAKAFAEGRPPWTVEREVDLGPGDRIDFVLNDVVGVEVKIKGQVNDVLRQLMRYANHARFEGLILVTTRMTMAALMPPALLGKPLYTIRLPGAF